MLGTLRERRRQMLRDEILQAARLLAAEKGYYATSMDELAARVGISKPTLYSYFATKEDLIVAAVAQSMQRLLDVIESSRDEQTPLGRLILFLRSAVQMFSQEGGSSRPMNPELMQLISSREETASYIQRIDAAIVDLIEQGIQQGEIDPYFDPKTVTLFFHALIYTLKLECFSTLRTSDSTDTEDKLATMFERGIRPQQHPTPNSQQP